MPQRYTWKKAEKLKSRKRIDLLFKKGKNFSVFPYKVFYMITPAAAPASASGSAPDLSPGKGPMAPMAPIQTGFGVGSRHFKKAVDRNRIKRLGREAWRLQKHSVTGPLSKKGLAMAVFLVYIGKDLPEYPMITARIGVILQKLIREVV